jgi:hypothetical protein
VLVDVTTITTIEPDLESNLPVAFFASSDEVALKTLILLIQTKDPCSVTRPDTILQLSCCQAARYVAIVMQTSLSLDQMISMDEEGQDEERQDIRYLRHLTTD